MKPTFRMYVHEGYYDLDAKGNIMYESSRNLTFNAADRRIHEWRIIGFTTRHNSRYLVPLEAAANGANLGQGWVHDLDHGTHRMWSSPTSRRAIKVKRL